MKFIPMLSSTEMVQAILDGRKTQTRRVVKEVPSKAKGPSIVGGLLTFDTLPDFSTKPKCLPGDVLWVREAFIEGYEMSEGSYKYDDEGNLIPKIWHKADNGLRQWYDGTSDWPTENIPWKPSIHMPKYACRLFLRVKSVRVERLQEISEDDAIAEGIPRSNKILPHNRLFPKYDYKGNGGAACLTAVASFQSLWKYINGEESWNSDPWVWVIEFEQIEKPENFC